MVILYLHNKSLPRIYNGKLIDIREDILQFWYGVSDTEYLLLSWPSQIIVRWFSKDMLAKHPLTEVVRSLGLQNINIFLSPKVDYFTTDTIILHVAILWAEVQDVFIRDRYRDISKCDFGGNLGDNRYVDFMLSEH